MENEIPHLIVTADGSHSLLSPSLNETYHSVHGALQESRYVFIEKGLEHWFNSHQQANAAVLEIGFGTGLNALLAIENACRFKRIISYTTIEAFPLESDTWMNLNYADSLGMKAEYAALHQAQWDTTVQINEAFSLLKCHTTLELYDVPPDSFDVIFYDAFAPSKQPGMWTIDQISRVVQGLRPGGVFVTYCAKGQLKRDLRTLGLCLQTLPGPPGKKEMVRAVKES